MRIASATLSAVRPPAKRIGTPGRNEASNSATRLLARAAVLAGSMAIQQQGPTASAHRAGKRRDGVRSPASWTVAHRESHDQMIRKAIAELAVLAVQLNDADAAQVLDLFIRLPNLHIDEDADRGH